MAILEAKDIVKIYPGTVALDHVNVEFRSGQVHALVGKNGSGKSTLLKIISGAVEKTSGSLLLDGRELQINSTEDAFKIGVATVYQEMSVLPELSVGENIFLSHMPVNRFGVVNWEKIFSESQKLLEDLGIDIDSHTIVNKLSIGQRQMVEIAKAMSTNPRILQLDEPTSAITVTEVEQVFNVIRKLKEKDIIIVYVSHKLHEIWDIADVCTVFRDGRYIGTEPLSTLSHPELIHMMFGEVQIRERPSDLTVGEETVLKVSNISYKNKVHDVSFELKQGEILGIAGMLGSGRTELLSCIFGAMQCDSGSIELFGKKYDKRTPAIMKHAGMGMTTEERQRQGLVLFQSLEDNLVMASIENIGKGMLYDAGQASEMSKKQEKELQIKTPSLKNLASSLSGGNQQKIVVGKWLNTDPKIMLYDEPSRGIDVNAKQQIFEIMWDQARKGISSIMVSTELEELLEVCHRIIIIKDGRLIYEIKNPDDYTIEQLYTICMGGSME